MNKNRWIRYPLLWLTTLLLWALLAPSVELSTLILGALLAFGVTASLRVLELPQITMRRPYAIFELLALVLIDVVRSNIAVVRIIVDPGTPNHTSGFVCVPMRLTHPMGLAVLGCIIMATPGTAWVRYDSVRSELTVHVLDLVDETAWLNTIKDRYEMRLLEIFQ